MNLMIAIVLAMSAAASPSPNAAALVQEAEAMKENLVGHSMGGREKCWKFQSSQQIRSLEIVDRAIGSATRTYHVRLELSDPRAGGRYRAEADVIYRLDDMKWSLWCVGLRSIRLVR